MKILFTSPILEHPAAGGPQLRIENSLKVLSQLASELHIVSRVNPHDLGGDEALRFYNNLTSHFSFSKSRKKVPSKLGRLMRYKFSPWYEKQDAKQLIQYANKHKFDLIWFGYGNLSHDLIKSMKHLRQHSKLVCDTDSVWSRFLEREIPFAPTQEEKALLKKQSIAKREEERLWVNWCDKTLAVSEVDALHYRDLSQNAQKVAVFSNVIDLAHYAKKEAPPPGFKTPCMFLSGTFGKATSAMNQAATWVIDDILPRVQAIIPNIHLYIVGNHSDTSFGKYQSDAITVTGKVKSVLPYLQNATVALTPLKYESGTRFKILEAGACKIPMVSTTLGAEGLEVMHDKELMISDDADGFAQSIVTLIQNPEKAKQLAQNCYDLVARDYSLEALKKQGEYILESI